MEKKIPRFFVDDNVSNQDWIKKASFDFPLESRETLEMTLGLTKDPQQRKQRLLRIMEWPTVFNGPQWLRDELRDVVLNPPTPDTQKPAAKSDGSGYFSKILGKPIGGMAEFDGDNDGFMTGPDGQDNVPYVPGVDVPEIPKPDVTKPDVEKTPEPEETPLLPDGTTPRERLKNIMSKIGKRIVPWRQGSQADRGAMRQEIELDARDLISRAVTSMVSKFDPQTVEEILEIDRELEELISPNAYPETAKTKMRGLTRLGMVTSDGDPPKTQSMAPDGPRNANLYEPDVADRVKELVGKRDDLLLSLTNSEEWFSLHEAHRNTSLSWVRNTDPLLAKLRDPNLVRDDNLLGVKTGEVANLDQDGNLKAVLIAQLAEDMRKLGITEEMAASVIAKLGPIISASAEDRRRAMKINGVENPSEVLLLANELIKQWARTANDNASPSIALQLVARDLMPKLTGVEEPYRLHEDFVVLDSPGAGRMTAPTLAEAKGMVADPEVRQVLEAVLTSSWARTQEQLGRLSEDGTVLLYRGMSSKAAHIEVDNRAGRGGRKARLANKWDEAREHIARGESIWQEADSVNTSRNERIKRAKEIEEEIEILLDDARELIDEFETRQGRESRQIVEDQIEEIKQQLDTLKDEYYELVGLIENEDDDLQYAAREAEGESWSLESLIDNLEDGRVERGTGTVDVGLLPLSSTATGIDGAAPFVQGDYPIRLETDLPIEQVVSTTCTGFGCHHEEEFVVSAPIIRDAQVTSFETPTSDSVAQLWYDADPYLAASGSDMYSLLDRLSEPYQDFDRADDMGWEIEWER